MHVEVISAASGLELLRQEWNDLLRTTPADSLFLTWEWMSAWWRVYGTGRNLAVLAARSDGRLVGLAPFMRIDERLAGARYERVAFIGWGGDVTPEYLDLIVEPGFEEDVVDAFSAWLAAAPHPRMLDFRPFPAESKTLALLAGRLARRAVRQRVSAEWTCPVFDLPATVDAFERSRSRNYRKKIGEYLRQCERQLQARVRVSGSIMDFRRDLATLVRLHHERWRGESQAFRTPACRQFYLELADRMFERDWIRLLTLEGPSGALASLCCFSYGGRYYYYQGGRDPNYSRYRVGLVLMHQAVRQAIAEGATVFDFLRGEEAYKNRWATRRTKSVRFVGWSSPGVRLLSSAHELMHRVAERGRAATRRGERPAPNDSWDEPGVLPGRTEVA